MQNRDEHEDEEAQAAAAAGDPVSAPPDEDMPRRHGDTETGVAGVSSVPDDAPDDASPSPEAAAEGDVSAPEASDDGAADEADEPETAGEPSAGEPSAEGEDVAGEPSDVAPAVDAGDGESAHPEASDDADEDMSRRHGDTEPGLPAASSSTGDGQEAPPEAAGDEPPPTGDGAESGVSAPEASDGADVDGADEPETAGEPSAGEPSAGEPPAGEPSAGEPSAGEPSAEGEDVAGEPSDVAPAPAAPDASADTRALFEGEEGEEEPTLPPREVRAIVEALVFASPQPVTPRQIGQVLASVSKKEWLAALEELKAEYTTDGRGLQLVEVAGGWQITTRPEYNDWVRELLDPKTPTRLSIQALETLAVIAYKQPVTLPEVIALRGVKSGGVIKTLLEKRLIRIVGRKEVVGRPMLYGTTKDFLLHFGLKDVGELPKIEEFAEVLGEEVDVAGLKQAIEAPTPVEVPLGEAEPETVAEPPSEALSSGEDDEEADPEDA